MKERNALRCIFFCAGAGLAGLGSNKVKTKCQMQNGGKEGRREREYAKEEMGGGGGGKFSREGMGRGQARWRREENWSEFIWGKGKC